MKALMHRTPSMRNPEAPPFRAGRVHGEPDEPPAEVEKRASAAGWHRGRLDGYDRIACPDCKDLIQGALPLAAPNGQATDTASHA